MRARILVVTGLLAACAQTPKAGPQENPCQRLPADLRAALLQFVEAGRPSASGGDDQLMPARRLVLARGSEAIPCLLDIYQRGPRHADWGFPPEQPGGSGDWALPLIRACDRPAAVPLYQELRARATDPLAKTQLDAELALLGDGSRMPHLLRFIEGPTPSAVGVGYVQERVLLAVSMHQYLPVLPALKKVRGTWIYPQLVDVVIAQLEGDATRLNAMLSEPSTSKHAALALHWMGNDEVLRGVAGDRGHSAHAMARAVLEGQVEP